MTLAPPYGKELRNINDSQLYLSKSQAIVNGKCFDTLTYDILTNNTELLYKERYYRIVKKENIYCKSLLQMLEKNTVLNNNDTYVVEFDPDLLNDDVFDTLYKICKLYSCHKEYITPIDDDMTREKYDKLSDIEQSNMIMSFQSNITLANYTMVDKYVKKLQENDEEFVKVKLQIYGHIQSFRFHEYWKNNTYLQSVFENDYKTFELFLHNLWYYVYEQALKPIHYFKSGASETQSVFKNVWTVEQFKNEISTNDTKIIDLPLDKKNEDGYMEWVNMKIKDNKDKRIKFTTPLFDITYNPKNDDTCELVYTIY